LNHEITAVAAAAFCLVSASADAEEWKYFPVQGGELGYEASSLRHDPKTGIANGIRMVHFAVPRVNNVATYSFVVQEIEYDCVGEKFRILYGVTFDAAGTENGKQGGVDLTPIGSNTPESLFKPVFCDGVTFSDATLAPTMKALFAALAK
jgi:hypothetical protein